MRGYLARPAIDPRKTKSPYQFRLEKEKEKSKLRTIHAIKNALEK